MKISPAHPNKIRPLSRAAFFISWTFLYGWLGSVCSVLSQGSDVGWSGSGGMVSRGGLTKSKNSVISFEFASRAVSEDMPKRASMNFQTEVDSIGVCEM